MSALPETGIGIPRYYLFFLSVLFFCTIATAIQFYSCAQEERCIFAEDFDVFYTPAHQMAVDRDMHAYPVEAAKAWIASSGTKGIFHYSLYPPTSLLLFYPLGFLSRNTALIIWDAFQLAVLSLSFCTLYMKRMMLLENMHGIFRFAPFVALVPFLMMTMFAGQIGILCAALFALTLAWRKTHLLPASLALAFLAVKPQLALMLPVLLLFERNWRVLILAGIWVLLIATTTFLLWGTSLWQDYMQLLALSPQLLAIAPEQLLKVSLSPALALRMVDIPAGTCLFVQSLLSLGVVTLCWRRFKNADEAQKIMLAATATFLLSPYSFHYDAVILAFVCMLLLKRGLAGMLVLQERIILLMPAFIPIVAVKLQAMHLPYGFVCILAAFLVTCTPRKIRPE